MVRALCNNLGVFRGILWKHKGKDVKAIIPRSRYIIVKNVDIIIIANYNKENVYTMSRCMGTSIYYDTFILKI